ncbi:MAG: sulfatase-like hydrolase/transferase [Kiritimatiellaeota bacterium]|nr:sulfatase-like hydrolase/transferase [Kiritimatiellota bacterium]
MKAEEWQDNGHRLFPMVRQFMFTFAMVLCTGAIIPAEAEPAPGATGKETAAQRPNVVIFFIDDMGYADIEPFGSRRNKTPHLSRMAEEGVRFTDFYNGYTACSPSRTSLLTGCYAGRVGMGGGVCFPNKPKALNPAEYTMAEMFKDAGYATGGFGKWHLGHLPGYLPPSHGFDEYWGIPYSNDMWNKRMGKYPPLPFVHNNEAVAIVDLEEDQSLLTRAFTAAALSFIRKNSGKSFFAYIPYSAVHGPRFAHKDFAGRKDGLRAQVEEIDAAVGEVMALLRELKVDRKTLVMFMSDNGGSAGTEIQPLRGNKGGPAYEGHMRTPFLAWWPGTIPAGIVSGQVGVTVDLLPTLAKLCGGSLSGNPIDGVDISAVFLDPEKAVSPRKFVYYKGEGLREGKWKLLGNELYDLEADVSEKNNVAQAHPDVVEKMTQELAQISRTIANQKRPNAQMNPCGPLVTEESAKKLPRLAEWMKQAQWQVHYDVLPPGEKAGKLKKKVDKKR